MYLVLSETAETLAIGNKIKCVDGVFTKANTSDNYQMIAEEAVTGVASTVQEATGSVLKAIQKIILCDIRQ